MFILFFYLWDVLNNILNNNKKYYLKHFKDKKIKQVHFTNNKKNYNNKN